MIPYSSTVYDVSDMLTRRQATLPVQTSQISPVYIISDPQTPTNAVLLVLSWYISQMYHNQSFKNN